MPVVAVSVEGVIHEHPKPGESWLAGHPIADGVRLVVALSSGYEVALLTEETKHDDVSWWLRQQALKEFYGLVMVRQPVQVGMDYLALREAQIRSLRALHGVALVVDTSPAVIAMCLRMGIPSMLFTHPKFTRPEFRPDHDSGRTWDEIVAAQEHDNVLKRQDVRLAPVRSHEIAAESAFEEVES